MQEPVRTYFEALAARWDERMPPDYGRRLDQFMRPLADVLEPARVVVEIGTGTGSLVPVLSAIVPGAALIALDLAHAMLMQAVKRTSTAHFVQADAHALPLPAERVDVVICHNSFPHFADKSRALREVLRILRPQGMLMILHNNPREVVNAIHSRAGYPIERDLLPPGDVLKAMLAAAGFSSLHVEDSDRQYVAFGQKP
jgi:ubiquinone/menaquinone biosynthesis C-methylase UbiE